MTEKADDIPVNDILPAEPAKSSTKGPSPADAFWDFKASHWATAILTSGILMFSGVQCCVYRKQAIIMKTQADIMETQAHISKIQGRPWVKVSATITGALRFADWNHSKGINVPLHFELKNYGPSPAVDVRFGARLVQYPGNTRRTELAGPQEETCKAIRGNADQKLNGSVDIIPTEQPAVVEQSLGLSGVYRTDDPILFAVVGCAVYAFAESEHGETGFRMILGRVSEDQIVGLPFIEGPPEPYQHPPPAELLAQGYPAVPPNVGLMQSNEVIFRSDDEGNYAK